MNQSSRALLEQLYRVAVAAVDAERLVSDWLVQHPLAVTRVALLALGKASGGMMRGAEGALGKAGIDVADRFLVRHEPKTRTSAGLALVGDHPRPGSRSAEAARQLERHLASPLDAEAVLVLLSGGTSSLVAGPVAGTTIEDVADLFDLLQREGLDITAMNRIRRRFLRWGGGRLAAALSSRPVTVLAISDVAGDRIEDIGSGPCSPDPLTAREVRTRLQELGMDERLPSRQRQYLERVIRGEEPETPKPGDPCFTGVSAEVLAGNHTALAAVARAAADLGWRTEVAVEMRGEARLAGQQIAARAARAEPGSCLVYGGETTVTLGEATGKGGRCQELALAASLELERLGAFDVTLLAAGTDGRDGPTDAAGAVIDAGTAARLRQQGLHPEAALAHHDTCPALDAVGALLRTGATGTNVRDVVVVVRR